MQIIMKENMNLKIIIDITIIVMTIEEDKMLTL